jgi:hypothetical protein
MKLFLGILVLLVPALALAQAIPNPDENLGGVLDLVISAFQGGNWFAAGALVVMLAVWFSGKFIRNPDVLPWLAAGIGMLLSVASGALGSQLPWYAALLKGVTTGGSAALFWSLAGKKILPSLVKQSEEPKPELDQKGPEV